MVRHLRFGRQTRDAVSGNAPRRRERLSRVSEWLTILGQQMTAALLIKPNRVNLQLASLFVSQYEALCALDPLSVARASRRTPLARS